MTETYEHLRDSATGEAGAAWKAADREEANLRTLYSTLKEDPRYTPEHKAEQAWAAYEAAKEKIAEGKAKARERLEQQVRSGERFSIPMPEGEHLVPSDTSKLLASQNEASRKVRKLERFERSGAGPFKRKPAEVLMGRVPRRVERRWWNRATETPVLVDVYDWTDDRLIFSVLVWPSLESSAHDADYVCQQRVREVLDTIARGAADKAWSTRWELDYGLRWDHERQVWTGGDGHAYDGERVLGKRDSVQVAGLRYPRGSNEIRKGR